MYYYVKADLSLITPGATTLGVYDGTSKKAAGLTSYQVAGWLKALNQHGAWMLLTEEYNHNGVSSSELNRTWEVRWTGPVNSFGVRDEFLLFRGSRDSNGAVTIAEWTAGQPTLAIIRDTIPAAWFEGFLSNDNDWRRLQRNRAA